MGKSMRKFKKLAVLAITIPTLLSSTNISFAMESNRQQSAFLPAPSDSYEVTYYNEFAMESPKQCESTKKQNKECEQYKNIRDGLGGFQHSKRFLEQKMENLSFFKKSPSTERFEKLEESYEHANACVVTCLNYIRSCISTLKLNEGGGKTIIKGYHKKEHILENTEQIVDRILKTLTTTLDSINDDKDKTNAWASIKYVVKQLHEGVQSEYITPKKVSTENTYLHKFIYRGSIWYLSNRKFNIDLIKTLYEKLFVDKDYKNRGVNGDSSFGEFAFKKALEVCTIHNYAYPKFNTSSPADVYAPTKQEEKDEQDEQVEDNAQEKSPKQPEYLIRKRITTIKNKNNTKPKTKPKCPQCEMNDYVVRNGHSGNNQRYICRNGCGCFTLDENGNVVKKVDIKHEYVECKNPDCKTYGTGEKYARPHGQQYTRGKDKTQMRQYMCTQCGKTFTQPINKNA